MVLYRPKYDSRGAQGTSRDNSDGNVTEPGVEPTTSGRMTEDRTTDLKGQL